jgi:prepilin-type N-terminal cleavage/methylation domain-containing protein
MATRGEATVNRLRVHLHPRADSDSGMTLIEVVVAIAILAILSTASLGVYLSGLNASSNQQRREIAVTVANESLEIVNGWSTGFVAATGKSALYTGRAKVDVQALFTAGAAVPGVTQTYPEWDGTAAATATSATTSDLPITRKVIRSGTEFIANLYIGTCFQAKAGGNCTAPGYPTKPSTVPAGSTSLTRVIVDVRWTAGASCAAGCSYSAVTLIDLNKDLEWNTND